jgi:hypothetical protein
MRWQVDAGSDRTQTAGNFVNFLEICVNCFEIAFSTLELFLKWSRIRSNGDALGFAIKSW